MLTRLGRTVVLVEDYDQAFAFYERCFQCRKLHDSPAEGGQRYLHIAFPGDVAAGIWFLRAADAAQQKLVGRQTGGQPLLVLYTDAIAALYAHLQSAGVTIAMPLVRTPESQYFHCLDLYGNPIVVVELGSGIAA